MDPRCLRVWIARRVQNATKAIASNIKARGKQLGGDYGSLTPAVRAASTAKFDADVRPQVMAMRDAGKSLRVIAAALVDAGVTTRSGSVWTAAGGEQLIERATPPVVA